MANTQDKSKEWHEKQLNLVEHTLCLFAKDVVVVPVNGLYQSDVNKGIMEVANRCHIYLIGIVPIIKILSVYEKDAVVYFHLKIGTQDYPASYKIDIPPGYSFVREGEVGFIKNEAGNVLPFNKYDWMCEVSYTVSQLNFEILYIGQAFGKSGERSALDRLKEHSTLQKIALQHDIPSGYRLEFVLLGIENGNQLAIEFNPFAIIKDDDISEKRIRTGLDKLNNTLDAEKVALYEAALIRYFQPQYNKQFKDSFPSTTLKVLQDCYDKDFRAVVAEINLDYFPYYFFSGSIEVRSNHMAYFDLHTEDNRKSFFSMIS